MSDLVAPPDIRADAPKPDYRARAEWIAARLSEGHKPIALAAALGVKRHVIYNTTHSQGADPRQHAVTRRPCMTCGEPFMSEGIHNRMCSLCRRRGDPFSPR